MDDELERKRSILRNYRFRLVRENESLKTKLDAINKKGLPGFYEAKKSVMRPAAALPERFTQESCDKEVAAALAAFARLRKTPQLDLVQIPKSQPNTNNLQHSSMQQMSNMQNSNVECQPLSYQMKKETETNTMNFNKQNIGQNVPSNASQQSDNKNLLKADEEKMAKTENEKCNKTTTDPELYNIDDDVLKILLKEAPDKMKEKIKNVL